LSPVFLCLRSIANLDTRSQSIMPGFGAVLAVVSSGAVLLQGCGGGAADPRDQTTCASGCKIKYDCHGDHIHHVLEGCGDGKLEDPKGTCEAYKKDWDGKKKEDQECVSAKECCQLAGDDASNADCKKAATVQCGGDPRPETTCVSNCKIEYECHDDHMHLHVKSCGQDYVKPEDPKGTCEAYQKDWDGKSKEDQACANAKECCALTPSDGGTNNDCKKAGTVQCGGDPRPKNTCMSGCEIEYHCDDTGVHLHYKGCDDKKLTEPEGSCEDYEKDWDGKSAKDKECASATECCEINGNEAEKEDCKKKATACAAMNEFDKFVARRSVETVI